MDYTAKEIEMIARLYRDYEKSEDCAVKDYKIDFDTALKQLDNTERLAVLEFMEDCRCEYFTRITKDLSAIFEKMAKYLN